MSVLVIDYGPDVEMAIADLIGEIEQTPEVSERYAPRWLATALLDEDPGLVEPLTALDGGDRLVATRDRLLEDLRSALGEQADTAIAAARFQTANTIAQAAIVGRTAKSRDRTDRIDAVLTNRYLGIPIFLALMWAVFKITTDIAGAFLDWIDSAVSGPIAHFVESFVSLIGLDGTWVESLLIDGVIAGVGAVLVFVPILLALYLALAFLEDTGYMARAAFVMDRVMRGVGLQGKAFLPMLVGFGCTVPAVYATRTLEDERDRILTSLLVPFMSCGARLPVYVIISAVFFPQHAGLVVFGMYLLGILVALAIGLVLKRTLLPVTSHAPTIMEMPPYRLPTFRTIWFHTWTRVTAFIGGAGSIIFGTMIVVWFLMAVPVSSDGGFADTDVDDSAFAAVSGVVAPAFAPAGFGTWEAAGSLLTGFVAKEVVVGTMAQVYGIEDAAVEGPSPSIGDSAREIGTGFAGAMLGALKATPGIIGIDLTGDTAEDEPSSLMASIRVSFEESSGGHGAAAALAFLVFVLLYTPCMAAVAAIRQETSTRWMWLSIVGQTAIAWAFAVVFFQGAKVLGL
ncbi:MAG: ferrous iron transport protein B [Acidimicrobiia bacterium]